MVLTRNNGEVLQAGYVNVHSNDWEDPFAWEHGGYFITNFKPSKVYYFNRELLNFEYRGVSEYSIMKGDTISTFLDSN